ncbi:hypothetical protein RHSIM_Rhsim12G0117200 [Rhododendron simsii]|uniref:Uncharacterized protein n=1 Tax=Rhododendron simsii TaxID=118357 RepID=A0A834L952_RHOSS|nr:hypothetical protein RHSIM_Rhsim12G0117200 [Rhododendron simsii]
MLVQQDEEFLNKLILQFCCGNTQFAAYPSMGKCLHLLDVHRKILLWPDTRKAKSGHRTKSWWRRNLCSRMAHEAGVGDEIIRSAIEIQAAGISFKKSKSQSLLDITFEGGNLRLPPIVVDNSTESMFLNLIAFERFHVGVGNAVTAYIFFMDSIIIGIAKNVSLLHVKGIIQNAIGSDKAVAELFNSIAKDATLDPASSLDLVHKRVDKYCKHWLSKWRAWLANFKHPYFRSP